MAAILSVSTEDSPISCALSSEEARVICNYVLKHEGILQDCEISLSIVSDEKIAKINSEFRGISSPTDVISIECERPNTADSDIPCELGDIVLAPAYIEDQATCRSTTPKAETRLLLVHGMLHLLGYDHLEDEDAKKMEAVEDEILEHLSGDPAHYGTTRHKEERS